MAKGCWATIRAAVLALSLASFASLMGAAIGSNSSSEAGWATRTFTPVYACSDCGDSEGDDDDHVNGEGGEETAKEGVDIADDEDEEETMGDETIAG